MASLESGGQPLGQQRASLQLSRPPSFSIATTITIGNGEKISFWNSAWIQSLRTKDLAPSVYTISKKKNRTLQEALTSNAWIMDLNLLHPSFSARLFAEFLQLWKNVQQSGQFSISSAYHAQFIGAISTNLNEIIWSAWAPPKCKFFSWLAVQDRIWTADRLQARGWMHNPACVLCRKVPEIGMHLFSKCRFTRSIWADISTWLAEPSLHPINWKQTASIHEWWSVLPEIQGVPRKGFKSLVILVCWKVWLERNARIFNRTEAPSFVVTTKIGDEASLWTMAGVMHLTRLIGRV
ncbi:hypothetical protein PAHAL_4G244300 [Panicum hallii]|uniref:Reverse transcriptase zinc-binding domain-containing protein n=1 Tax=Panicum hallii TaxID=206008 RepID=A0A2T8JDT7_9POAL|nr:hypothetical protein PAHAL_4G244300 [Panicum hallii]